MKRLDSPLESNKIYKFDSQLTTDMPSEGSLRSLKGIGITSKEAGGSSDYNDNLKKVESRFSNQNLDGRLQVHSRNGHKDTY